MNFDEVEIKSIEKIDLQNGDVLAVYIKNHISNTQKENLKDTFKNVFEKISKKVEIVIITGDEVKLQVIRTENDIQ